MKQQKGRGDGQSSRAILFLSFGENVVGQIILPRRIRQRCVAVAVAPKSLDGGLPLRLPRSGHYEKMKEQLDSPFVPEAMIGNQ